MSEVGGLLVRVVSMLDAAGIPFMVAGSFASTAHGAPRATQDLDLVIDPRGIEALEALVRGMSSEEYYADLEAAREAFRRRSMFNVIELASGWKIDLIVRKDRPFSREEFSRRQAIELFGVRIHVASPEDTVIAKLEWSQRSGGSERQRRDVRGILRTIGDALDRAYIEDWVSRLRLEDEWRLMTAPDPEA